MDNPRVSIMLPTYNRGELLDRCIRSVLAQDFTDWELIILDDCSSDNTYIICKKFEEDHDNIAYHRNKIRKGLPENRNTGIAISNGDLVLFIEDDLLLDKNCLKKLVETYDKLKEGEKVGGIAPRLIDGKLKQSKRKQSDPCIFNKFTGMMYDNYSTNLDSVKEVLTMHACSLYKKDALKEVGGYAETAYKGNYKREESDLNFRLRKVGYKLYFQSDAKTIHSKVNSGGCRVDSKRIDAYYTVRNHIIFTVRIFGIKSLYMIPLFLLDFAYKTLKYIFVIAVLEKVKKENK
ncbi:MAG TPA: hypothetical protein C5S37_01340 [Methanophagales archaeon]|nr:hypothetical protein [Methanophagales archaeon]